LIAIALAAAAVQPAPLPAASEAASVDSIMALVARNQDQAQELRQRYVYNQSLILRFRRGNGKLAREETREYVVTPTENGTNKELMRFAGSFEQDGRMVPYSGPGFTYQDTDLDGELMRGLADDLANDRQSRDGIAADLFPLTTEEQRKYRFKLEKTEDYRGRLVHQITFKPVKELWEEDDGTPWKGEILVDAAECQPVLITTQLAKDIPVPVRVFLGTNVKGLGFKLSYQKFEEGVWFPVSYGAEFELKALFFYSRKIAIALNNSGFKKGIVDTNVTFDPPQRPDKNINEPKTKAAPAEAPLSPIE
jgi:hypothetical protein